MSSRHSRSIEPREKGRDEDKRPLMADNCMSSRLEPSLLFLLSCECCSFHIRKNMQIGQARYGTFQQLHEKRTKAAIDPLGSVAGIEKRVKIDLEVFTEIGLIKATKLTPYRMIFIDALSGLTVFVCRCFEV